MSPDKPIVDMIPGDPPANTCRLWNWSSSACLQGYCTACA